MNYKKDEFEEEDQTDNFSFCSYTVLFLIKIWKTINKYRLVMKNTQIVILKNKAKTESFKTTIYKKHTNKDKQSDNLILDLKS